MGNTDPWSKEWKTLGLPQNLVQAKEVAVKEGYYGKLNFLDSAEVFHKCFGK